MLLEQCVLFRFAGTVHCLESRDFRRISDAFPTDVQSLAGGVFSEICQFGNSVGSTIIAVIARSVSQQSGVTPHMAWLMVGFRAAFWTIFASCVLVILLSFFGLSKEVGSERKLPTALELTGAKV